MTVVSKIDKSIAFELGLWNYSKWKCLLEVVILVRRRVCGNGWSMCVGNLLLIGNRLILFKLNDRFFVHCLYVVCCYNLETVFSNLLYNHSNTRKAPFQTIWKWGAQRNYYISVGNDWKWWSRLDQVRRIGARMAGGGSMERAKAMSEEGIREEERTHGEKKTNKI